MMHLLGIVHVVLQSYVHQALESFLFVLPFLTATYFVADDMLGSMPLQLSHHFGDVLR